MSRDLIAGFNGDFSRLAQRNRAYAVTAILVLAFGVACTSIALGILKASVLNPLPYPQADRIQRLYERHLPDFPTFSVAPGNFLHWQANPAPFTAMAMFTGRAYTLRGAAGPVRLRGTVATDEFFAVLGTLPVLGHTFESTDASGASGALRPAVLSHVAWMSHFGGDPRIVGRDVDLDGEPFTVIGVMPDGFDYPNSATDVWTLWRTGTQEQTQHGAHYASAIARLRDDASPEQARIVLASAARQLASALPHSNAGWQAFAVSLPDDLLGDVRFRLLILLAGSGLVLLISGINVASLSIARVSERFGEFAIRRTYGATFRHFARDLAREASLVGLAGGIAGGLLTGAALPLIRALAPTGIPRIGTLAVDPIVILFALMVAVFVAVLGALIPAFVASRRTITIDLRANSRSATDGRSRARTSLVVGEVALATILLIGGGLLSRSFLKLLEVDPGFQAEDVVVTTVTIPPNPEIDASALNRFVERLLPRLREISGVTNAAISQSLPLMSDEVVEFHLRGAPTDGPSPTANYFAVSPDYFAAMGIKLIRGRGLQDDDWSSARSIVVSDTFVQRYLGGPNPIGRAIRIDERWYDIVGVVGAVRQYSLAEQATAQVYVPYSSQPSRSLRIVLRTRGPAKDYTPDIRQAVRDIDPALSVERVARFSDVVARTIAGERFQAWALITTSVIALFLSATGLYGMIALSVSQRTREIGVRLALGAQRSSVFSAELRRGLGLASTGVAIGVVLALIISRVAQRFLFGVAPYDPITVATAVVVIMFVAGIASSAPALRAAQMSPTAALRHD